MIKRITVRDVFEALKKNGYPWGRGLYEDVESGTFCAMGQAARNLNVDPNELHTELNDAISKYSAAYPANAIETFNDDKAETYEDVVKFAEKVLSPYFNRRFFIHTFED